MRKWTNQDYREMPWKNGGGSTKELAIFPEGAILDHFVWRLSTATVSQAGDFSYFSQIDRTLAILSGEGLILKKNLGSTTQEVLELTDSSLPYHFSGETPIFAELLQSDGLQTSAVVDLNMMTRRDVCQHHMQRLTAGEHVIAEDDAQQVLLYCAHGAALIGRDLSLQAGDLVLLEEEHERAGIQLHVQAEEGAILYMIRISFLNHTEVTAKSRSNLIGSMHVLG
jgi:environmental stress-induced protein Ves